MASSTTSCSVSLSFQSDWLHFLVACLSLQSIPELTPFSFTSLFCGGDGRRRHRGSSRPRNCRPPCFPSPFVSRGMLLNFCLGVCGFVDLDNSSISRAPFFLQEGDVPLLLPPSVLSLSFYASLFPRGSFPSFQYVTPSILFNSFVVV